MAFTTVIVISGGVGTSAEQVLNTVLAQFPEKGKNVQVDVKSSVHHPEQVDEILEHAVAENALVVHTMVNKTLRMYLEMQAQKMQVKTIDLMGPMCEWFAEELREAPLERPGFYRQLRKEYFQRVDAIDFALAHDDGKDVSGLKGADVVLVGASRVGKTPLCFYLAVMGWQAANIPLVPGANVPEILWKLDRSRVFGVTIDPGQLIQHRQKRQYRLGIANKSEYMQAEAVYQELEAAKAIFRKGGFSVIDMTDSTIEMGADKIIRQLTRALSKRE